MAEHNQTQLKNVDILMLKLSNFIIKKAFILHIFLLLIFSSQTLLAWKMEADIIDVKKTSGDTITHINFRQAYDTAPLVFTLASNNGNNRAALRVNNITTTGFDIYSNEPQGEGGSHTKMKKIPYIAIEPGEYTMPDGTKIVAKTVNTKKYQQAGTLNGSSWEHINLNGFGNAPTVLAQIQTRVNERTDENVPDSVSKPWMTTAINNIANDGFDLALERSETSDGSINNEERVAYLAIESNVDPSNHYFGDNKQNKIEYETKLTNNLIKGWDDGAVTINFAKSYSKPVVVAHKESRIESDGGWFRRTDIQDSSISLVIDEDKAQDNERSHTEEKAGYLLFSKPFDATFYDKSDAKLIINEVMYSETVKGANNDEFIEFYVKDSGNLQGYGVSDQDCNYYLFKNSCTVSVGDYIILHTGSGTDSCSGKVKHFYQGKNQYFNNSKDDVLVINSDSDVTTTTNTTNCGQKAFNGKPIDYMAYGTQGGAVDAVPTSLNGVTLSWDETKVKELDNADDGVSVALTPNAIDSDSAKCWEFSESGNAADNGCSNYKRTTDDNIEANQTNSLGIDNNAMPNLSIEKTSIVLNDPVNGETKPKRIPGAALRYCFKVDNTGEGNAKNSKIKDSLSGNGKDNLTYVKSGAMLQDISTNCDCQSSSMDESKGSISGSDVQINLDEIVGSHTPQNSRACAFIEVEVK